MTSAENTCADLAGKLSRLPPFGTAVLRILSISLDDESALSSFEEVFKSDPALTAELLVMANSAAFGGRFRVQTIGLAIRLLGLERVRSMAATSALRAHTRRAQRHAYLASVWAHGIASAVAAEALGDTFGCQGLYTLGLTHDLGRLGLFLTGGKQYAEELSQEFADLEQALQVERDLFGMTHCQAGALVAKAWGFPESLAGCMGEHHAIPADVRGGPQGLVATACMMAASLGFPEVPLRDAPAWPDVGVGLANHPQLEPETLWDEITRRMEDLGR